MRHSIRNFNRNAYLNQMMNDFWHMRDDDGNIFHSNFSIMEDAESCVEFFKRFGVETVIRHGEEWQKKAIAKYKLAEDIYTVYFINTPDLLEKRNAIPFAEYMAYVTRKSEKPKNNETSKPYLLAKTNKSTKRKNVGMNS